MRPKYNFENIMDFYIIFENIMDFIIYNTKANLKSILLKKREFLLSTKGVTLEPYMNYSYSYSTYKINFEFISVECKFI